MSLKSLVCLSFILIGFFPFAIKAGDQLIIIQATSGSGKTFVIRKGADEGVSIGQESLFSTKNSSFAAVCKEVSRYFSLWRIKDRKGQVPFTKGDYVTYTNNIESIWSELPKLQIAPKEELVFKENFDWIIKGNYTYGINESVSDTTQNKTGQRVGYQLEVLYADRFAVNWEWAVGARFDRENATLTAPILDVPTNRYLLSGQFTYHFKKFANSDNNVYASIGAAYGITNTTVDQQVSTGTALVIPSFKLGYLNRVAPTYAMIFELGVESLAQTEAFANSSAQTTSIMNTKFSVGVRF